MKFSVIIPVYNCEDTLPRCVESILNQTYHDWELFLIDDGSSDGSLSLCEYYSRADGRIRTLHQENAGQGAARNKGIASSTGDYLIYCDSDDFYERESLEIFAEAAKKYGNPDLIIGGYREFQLSGDSSVVFLRTITDTEKYLCCQEDIRRAYIPLRQKGLITSPWAKAYRSELIIDHNVCFPDLRRCQDVIFNLKVYDQINSLGIVSKTVYYYQTPDGTVYTAKFPVDMFDIHKYVYRQIRNYLKKWSVDDASSARYLNKLFIKDVSVLLRLNYQNQWNLDRKSRRALSRRMLNDTETIGACATSPDGTMNKLIRSVVKSRSVWLANLFGFGSVFYQKLHKRRTD